MAKKSTKAAKAAKPMTMKQYERSAADKKMDKAALAKINAKRGAKKP